MGNLLPTIIQQLSYIPKHPRGHGVPTLPDLTRAEVEHSVSHALWPFMNKSRRLMNERMKKELKVKLRYQTVSDALKAIEVA